MSMPIITYCPGTLAEGFTSYSPGCLRNVFNGKKVSPFLPYDPPNNNDDTAELFAENRKRISISGVQEKLSFVLDKNILRLTKQGEHGTHILKPIPTGVKKAAQVPANEHLTMQIAAQVYALRTAENAMIFFKDGTPAYITKRFDSDKNGVKRGVEDFASLAGKTTDNAGPHFKYDYSYEQAGQLLKTFVPAWKVEIEKYFALLLFNYVFCNGDAHLKNYSVIETSQGDYFLAPAYDLMNTRLHLDDTDFALQFFADKTESTYFSKKGHRSVTDFMMLAHRLEIPQPRAEKIIQLFCTKQSLVYTLIQRSFLNEQSKKAYALHYETRLNYMNEQ